MVANLIHHNSERRQLAMVKINCGAIPDNLLESELFGYERGAFTGAARTKKGLLELANGGTVFLDEIGELPLPMQSKLLTFLEDRRFKRVGGLNDIEVNVRVIAATNRDLRQSIARKEFREDLFYRLNVMQIAIPPLRERPEDILPLSNYFLAHFNRKFGKNIQGLDSQFEKELTTYSWKGNVRELRNVLERCALFCEGDVLDRAAFLEAPFPSSKPAREDMSRNTVAGSPDFGEEGVNLPKLLEGIERDYIERALQISGNNYSKAAELLGITRFTLRRKLEQQ
ncbi:Regulatory protein AtoC [bioreactor metagenome]|uniref:Regulatory protein AtoC n=1 Tax=bioreactor metagenome TaxID=1076179 RepID=A0A645DZJ6_9ZZZZ